MPGDTERAIGDRPRAPATVVSVQPLVMIVDDSMTVRKITSRLLQREGFAVTAAKDGVDALQLLGEQIPDVILLDIEMPRMDGFEFAKTIKSDPKYVNIPIIMITSRTAEKHRSRAAELGVDLYLGKPYQEDKLLAHLREITGVAASGVTAARAWRGARRISACRPERMPSPPRESWCDDGHLLAELRRRVAHRTESQRADAQPELRRYLSDEIGPALAAIGFVFRIVDNPVAGGAPFLLAERSEDAKLADAADLRPRRRRPGLRRAVARRPVAVDVTVDGDRWYGRGTADNKGQHSINLAALARVLAARGRLGFNVKLLLEMGEETGSPGLRALCERERAALAADVFIASDGPRLRADRPTLFLGSRGAFNFDLAVDLRDGRPSFRQLGRPAGEPGHDPRERDRLAGRCARAHPGRRLAAAADSGLGAPCACRTSSRASRADRRWIPTGASRV